jgi:flagellar FliJ protein
MARYTFPLQQLLDLRSRTEDDAQRQLAETQRETRKQLRQLIELHAACAEAADTVALRPGQVVEAGALLNNGLHLAQLQSRTAGQQLLVEQCTQREQWRHDGLLAATRDREALERLKQRRAELHRREQSLAEARQLDEACVMMFRRNHEPNDN